MELTGVKKNFYNLIDNIVNFNKISHAYLIEIGNYDEDFCCVLDFVKMILNSSDSDGNISNLVDMGNYPDLKIIEPDGTMIKKYQLAQLQENFRNKSFLNNKMIYIIKEADKLNDSAGNTILKFLEEPEEDIIAILVTTNRYKVIETILSRCQVLSIQNSHSSENVSDVVYDFIKLLVSNDLFINYNYIFSEILVDKESSKKVLNEVEEVFLNYLNYISDKSQFSCNLDLVKILSPVSVDRIIDMVTIIEEELKKLDYNVNYKLWLDCLFARLIGG